MEVFSGFMSFLMLGAGLFLTVRLGFFQFTHIGKALTHPFRRDSGNGGSGMTSFQAMATALGGSIGTANIAGVAGALIIGGVGSIFWMWLAGILGMATKLAEIVLALRYRDTSMKPPLGGAMLYIEKGLGRRMRPLAVCFAVFGCLASLVGTALVQSNTIALASFDMLGSLDVSIERLYALLLSGILTAAAAGAVIAGGAKRIGSFSERAVPAMAFLYIASAVIIISINHTRLLPSLKSIFDGAFGLSPAVGGFFGAGMTRAMRVGVARGVYSNEAGVGSAPMAHASSSETDPVRQGLWGIFEVFVDTILMCTLTALVILTSGVDIPFGTANYSGMTLANAAFSSVFGTQTASVFLSVSILLFAFTSIVGWSMYGERCVCYLWGSGSIVPFRTVFLLLIPVGAIINVDTAWKLGELFNYLMALPNIAALLSLSGRVSDEVRQYKMFEKSSGRHYNGV